MRMPVMIAATVCLSGCFSPQVEHGDVAFAVSPDDRQVVFSAADGDLYLLSVDTRRVTRLTETESRESSPSFSPDGGEILYSSGIKGREGRCILARTLDGKQTRQLTDDPEVSDSRPAYSRDGNRIAFARAYRHRPYSMGGWTWDQFDLCVMNRDGTNLQRITNRKYYQLGKPSFIEGDKILLFAAVDSGVSSTADLYSIPSDGTQEPKRSGTPRPPGLESGAWATDQSVSADGKQIAFVSDRAEPFKYDICLRKLGDTDVRSLGMTTVSHYNQQPTFLSDGKSIMFLAGTESNASNRPIFSLWKGGLDGGKPSRIADSQLFTDPLHWTVAGPDPAR